MKYGRSLLLTALVTIVVAGMAHRLVTSKLVQPGRMECCQLERSSLPRART